MEAVLNHIHKAFQVGHRRVAGHGHRAEAVHRRLQQHIGKGEHTALDPRRNADAQHLLQGLLMKPQLSQLQTAAIGAANHEDHNGNGRAGLRQHRRQGHAVHIPSQIPDKENVEPHIHNPRRGENHQGAFGVPRRPDHGGAEIVEHMGGNPQEIDFHIGGRQPQHLFRGAHGTENPSG